jgi:hypothetical protein
MRVPRVRFTVWCMMAAVAVVALTLGHLRRSYPVRTTLLPADAGSLVGQYEIIQHWSDGRVQTIEAQCPGGRLSLQTLKASEPWPKGRRRYGPLLRIEWSDGSTSYYLDGRRSGT